MVAISPFIHRLHLSWFDLFPLLVTGPVLVPIRLSLLIIITLFSWMVAKVGVLRIRSDELELEPLSGWRNVCQRIFWKTSYLFLWALGFRF